jgi:hypothetical protein
MRAQEFRHRSKTYRAFAVDAAAVANTKQVFISIAKRWNALAAVAEDNEYRQLAADALATAEQIEDSYSRRTYLLIAERYDTQATRARVRRTGQTAVETA